MRTPRTTRRTAAVLAGAAAATALAFTAGAVMAGNGPADGTTGSVAAAATATPGTNGWAGRMGAGRGGGMGAGWSGGMSAGMGAGWSGGMGGGMGSGAWGAAGTGAGSCLGTGSTTAQGTLTTGQKATLASLAEEEKIAHDLYVAFAARYDDTRFDRIALAETQHLAALRRLMTAYGVTDPTLDRPEGSFATSTAKATYDRLLTKGAPNLTSALAVGAEVERADIADLTKAGAGLDAPDVATVYSHLTMASQMHLRAFTS